MALGGGTWLTQNKVLPGSYINFISLARASANLSDRGVATAPFELNWGPEGTVFEVESGDFIKNSKAILGYAYDAPEMLNFREIFAHAVKVICYRLGTGAAKASNSFGAAKYPGTRGNDITIAVESNVDDETMFDVTTYISGAFYEKQTVKTASELVDNDFVVFNKTVSLEATAGIPMTGGANCASITGEHHQAYLDAVESYSYNTMCCPAKDATTVKLYEKFNERLRDEIGAKSQLVAWQSTADFEGVIGVWNKATHNSIENIPEQSLVYWVAGIQAGTAVNEAITNAVYDGELTVDVKYTQSELTAAIKAGKFMLHSVNGDVRILEDINTLVSVTPEKGDVFKANQTIRVCDQIANDTAVVFNTRYIGKVRNTASGRALLWSDIVKLIRELERIEAVESFDPDTVKVDVGDSKKAVVLTVDGLNVVNAMSQLYMSVIIR